MNVFFIIGIVIASIFVLIILTSIVVAEILAHPRRKKYVTNINKRYDTTEFLLKSEDDISIKGWFIHSNNKTDKCFIYCHGYTCKRDTPPFDLLADELIQSYNVITFEFRGHGASGGRMSTAGMQELADLKAVLKYAKEDMRQSKICIYGLSMGANVCLRGGELDNVDMIVVDSPFINLEEYLVNNLKVWSKLPGIFTPFILTYYKIKMGKKYKNIDALKSVVNYQDKPLMLIHALDDRSISYKNSEKIYETRNNKDITEIYLPEHGGHCRSYQANEIEYKEKVTSFVRKYL